MELITACRALTQVADLLQMDWDGVQRLVARAVARGVARRELTAIRYVGLDEKSFLRGQCYGSVASDILGRRVLEGVPDRDQVAGKALWQMLPEEQHHKVEAAAMDMSGSFVVSATRVQAPQAAIVHDKFHVAKMLNEAVDQTRRAEHLRLQATRDDTLKHPKFLWLKGLLKDHQQAGFAALLEINLQTAKAWAYKEQFIEFWAQPDAAQGALFFKDGLRRVNRTKLTRVKAVAKTLKKHLTNLLTYFMHPITNAISEGFDSKIQALKSDARGFCSFANYRARILFHCGKLSLLPTLPASLATH